MKPLRTAIVDDDPIARMLLSDYCERCGLNVVGEFVDAMSAAVFQSSEHVDFLLLDVQMPGMSGLELASMVAEDTAIVITTGNRDYAPDAFEIGTVDFLIKPVSIERFQLAVDRVVRRVATSNPDIQQLGSDNSSIFVKVDGSLQRILLSKIQLIEAQKDYLTIHTRERSYFVHSTMKAILEKLPVDSFVRVHRSFTVRFDEVSRINANSVVVAEREIPVGVTYRESLASMIDAL